MGLSPETNITTDRVPDARPHLQTESTGDKQQLEKDNYANQESEVLVESNSEPSLIAREAAFAGSGAGQEGPGAATSKETSSGELNTSSEIDQAAKEHPGEDTKEKNEVQFLLDSSGDAASISPPHQTFQESPLSSSAYPLFPPTPTSDTPRPRPRRLGSMFEDIIRPMSFSSSPLESPLLHAKHRKSSLHSKKSQCSYWSLSSVTALPRARLSGKSHSLKRGPLYAEIHHTPCSLQSMSYKGIKNRHIIL